MYNHHSVSLSLTLTLSLSLSLSLSLLSLKHHTQDFITINKAKIKLFVIQFYISTAIQVQVLFIYTTQLLMHFKVSAWLAHLFAITLVVVKSVLAMMDSLGMSTMDGRLVTTGCQALPLPGYSMAPGPPSGCCCTGEKMENMYMVYKGIHMIVCTGCVYERERERERERRKKGGRDMSGQVYKCKSMGVCVCVHVKGEGGAGVYTYTYVCAICNV